MDVREREKIRLFNDASISTMICVKTQDIYTVYIIAKDMINFCSEVMDVSDGYVYTDMRLSKRGVYGFYFYNLMIRNTLSGLPRSFQLWVLLLWFYPSIQYNTTCIYNVP